MKLAYSYVAKMAPKKRRKVTTTYRRLSALSRQMGNAVSADLVNGIVTFKTRVSSEKISEAWAKGDYSKAMSFIPWHELPGDMLRTTKGLSDTIGMASKIQIEKLPKNVNENLRFDVTNPGLRFYLEKRTGSLVQGIHADTQAIIQNEIAKSFTNALTPDEVARQIKGSIGLYPRQETALRNYRLGLIEQGVSLEKVDIFSDAYEERLLDYRARMIARTETRLAVNQAQLSVWQEGINQGLIDKENARKEWVVDGEPCEICEPMDGVRVPLDDTWSVTYPDGSVSQIYNPTESHPHCLCGMELYFSETEEEEQ